MPQALTTGRSHFWPPSFLRSNKGELFISNGVDPILRWNGLTSTTQNAGLVAPTVKLTIAGSGTAGLTGTYTAYYRFVDADGIPSSLSPISSSLVLTTSSGTISA